MTEIQISAIYSQFLGEFTANFKDSYLLAYSPMCEIITSYLVLFQFSISRCNRQVAKIQKGPNKQCGMDGMLGIGSHISQYLLPILNPF